MIIINFSNVEELIFYNTELQNMLPPSLFSIFEQWRLSMQVPYLKDLGKQSLLDFLNTVSNDEIEVLEAYFGEKVYVEKLNYSIAHNMKIPLCNAQICQELCSLTGFNYLSTWRDDEYLYISFWR